MNVPESVAAESSDLRERILEHATQLFAERGYVGTTVRAVVEAAGCTKPALYYYFANKEALFLEALRNATEQMDAHIEETARVGGTIREQLAQGIRTFFDALEQRHMSMRLLMRAELQPEDDQPEFDFVSVRSRNLKQIEELLAAGVPSEIRADVDLEDAARAIAGMVDQRLRSWLVGEKVPKDTPERVLRIFFDGVGR